MSPVALRPGYQINLKTTPPSRTAPTDTGQFFCVGMSEKGDPTKPVLCRNMNDFAQFFGQRVAYGVMWDSADVFFREGGTKFWGMRVIGPAPVTATLILKDTGTVNSVTINAKNAGAWGNNLKVGVVAGGGSGTIQLQVTDLSNNVLEQSPDLTTKSDIVTWAANFSQYINAVDLGTSLQLVAAAPVVLTGAGTGNEASAVDAQWLAAISAIPASVGPGQVAMPGRTTDVAHGQILAHCAVNNRFGLLDVADSATTAALITSAATARTTTQGQYGMMLAPFLTVPGLVANTVRTIPPSPVAAALMAASDAIQSPAVPAAGNNGQTSFVIGTDFEYTDTQRDALNTAGLMLFHQMLGGFRLYGYRTLADPISQAYWTQANWSRLAMAIVAQAGVILQNNLFLLMDGQGSEFARLAGQLIGMLQPYFVDGSLYGTTPDNAFAVDTSTAVNTPTEVAAGNLHAQIALRMTPFAELVVLDIIKTPTTQSLS